MVGKHAFVTNESVSVRNGILLGFDMLKIKFLSCPPATKIIGESKICYS